MTQEFLNQFEAELQENRVKIFRTILIICSVFSVVSTCFILFIIPDYIYLNSGIALTFLISYLLLTQNKIEASRHIFFGSMLLIGGSQSLYFGPDSFLYLGIFSLIIFLPIVYNLEKEYKTILIWATLFILTIPIVFVFYDKIPFKHETENTLLIQTFNVINVLIVILIEIGVLLKTNLKTQKHLNDQYLLTEKLKIEYENLYKNLVRNLQYSNQMQGIMHLSESAMLESISNYFVFSNDKNSSSEFYLLEHVNKKVYFCVARITGLEIGNGLISNLCYNGLIKAVKVNQLNQADKIHCFISDFLNETFYETENLNIEVTLSVSVLDTRTNKINSFGNYPISYLVCLPNNAYTLKKELETIDQTENFQLFIPPGSNFYLLAGIDFHKTEESFLNKSFLHLETVFRTIFLLPFKNQLDILTKDLTEVKNEFNSIETLTIFGIQFEKSDLTDINENV